MAQPSIQMITDWPSDWWSTRNFLCRRLHLMDGASPILRSWRLQQKLPASSMHEWPPSNRLLHRWMTCRPIPITIRKVRPMGL
jgi:hypothetical protein